MNKNTKVSEFRLKLYPNDFHSVRNFYENTLGYTVIKEWNKGEDDLGVMFDTGTAILELLSPANEYLPIQGVGLSLEVIDVKALREELDGKVTITRDIRHTNWGDTAFTVSDPEGFKITFFTRD